MWSHRFDNSSWHFPGCACVINLTKFTSRLFSAWEIGHKFHLKVSFLFSLSVQHPVAYNTWQLKEIHYSEEVSDVESAPWTVPKTSCEPEQQSQGETEHTAHTVIKSGDKTHGNHIKKPPWKQPNHQHCSCGALQLRAAAAWTLLLKNQANSDLHWKYSYSSNNGLFTSCVCDKLPRLSLAQSLVCHALYSWQTYYFM